MIRVRAEAERNINSAVEENRSQIERIRACGQSKKGLSAGSFYGVLPEGSKGMEQICDRSWGGGQNQMEGGASALCVGYGQRPAVEPGEF